MFWIAGAAGLLAVLLPLLGWRSPHRQTIAVWSGGLGCLLVLLLPVSAGAFIIGAFGAQAEHLDVVSLLAFGPLFFALALGFSFFILIRDWRWRASLVGAGVLAVLLIAGWFYFVNA